MLWRDQIELIQTDQVKNSKGEYVDVVPDPNDPDILPNLVYANKKSVRQSEFYQSFAADLKAENMFEVRADEYNDERMLKFEGEPWYIIRTFTKNGEIMELICSRYPMG